MKNIKNSLKYAPKTSKIMDFLYTTLPILVTRQTPRADKISKIVVKAVQEDFDDTYKKSN